MLVKEIVFGEKNTSWKAILFTRWNLPGEDYGHLKTKTNDKTGKTLQNEHVMPVRFTLACELLHLATGNQLCYI